MDVLHFTQKDDRGVKDDDPALKTNKLRTLLHPRRTKQ